ncbi:hypothetical protein EDD85DRAFT_953359 [Armillaria nabsnona]|nr:hypothetical protein EDD85DRAFT_953359 [Armillaria nabsnona]
MAVDANFHLRRLNVSDEINDPSLNQGYAYFMEEEGFKAHLETYSGVIPEEEKSMCNNHDAVKLANSRGGKGAAVTGVSAVVCGCHNMKRPLSVGDLQKGERYLNMDYFILSTLSYDTPPDLVISYDIVCQWHKNFFARMEKYLASLYLVPKFHLPAHILSCRNNFSFNFSAKVGWTDGEAPERGWAATNALANSMKEMGPGSHWDTLDDHFGNYNWRKIIIIASTICKRYKDAVAARAQHVAEFISYKDALRADHSTALHQWRTMVLAWESDRTQANPFSPTLRHESVHDPNTARLIDDIKKLGTHSTDLQRTRIQQQTNRISRKIEAWIEIQKVYMPKTSLLHTWDDDRHTPGVEIHPTKIPLYLPSMALQLGAVDPSPTNTTLNDERRLQLAQVHDTLATLCDHLLLKSYLTIWHQRFSREGHHSLSWIWKTNLQGGEEGLQEALHIEWCKSRAQAQHWQDECKLLTEEIHRIKVMFQFYNNVWNDRARKVSLPGARAYTLKQAALWQELGENAGRQWSDTLASLPPVSQQMPDPTLDLDSPGRISASVSI